MRPRALLTVFERGHSYLRYALVLVAAVAVTGADVDSAAGLQHRIQRHIVVQNTWFTDADLRRYGVRNDLISISGHWLLQQGTHGGTFKDFLSKSEEDVKRRLDNRFKAAHPEVDPDTGASIVIDIERPHPKDLHEYSKRMRSAIVGAYKTRIAATKAAFPNAKLGLYGTLNPDGRGRANDPTYQGRRRVLTRAGREGLYDDLDYLVPVLYVRFGCDDEVNGPCDRHWDTLDEYTQLGVDGSRRLRRSDGSTPPLLPLLGFRVYNGNSAFHRELLMNLGAPDAVDATLGKQIGILADNGVGQFALWTGKDSNELGGPTDPTVTDYLCELFRPRCPRREAPPRTFASTVRRQSLTVALRQERVPELGGTRRPGRIDLAALAAKRGADPRRSVRLTHGPTWPPEFFARRMGELGMPRGR